MRKCGASHIEWCYPAAIDRGATVPLVIMMAGRGGTVDHMLETTFPVFQMLPVDLGAIVFGIEGDTSTSGVNSWNASQECCWPPLDPAPGDDDAYIATQIAALIAAGWPVDPDRIYIIGHSAGQAMAFRYACNHPSQIAAVFGMSTFGIRTDIDPACAAGNLSYVHFHGTLDNVDYDNSTNATLGPNTVEFVSVEVDRVAPTRTSTATQLLNQNGCTGSLSTSSTLDFDALVPGSETDIRVFATCPADGEAQIWRGNGSMHTPDITAAGYSAVVQFFEEHPKP